ncbi:MAG: T9SS type A sorting domain-containing protein [Candidatus Kapabacteria bacterium]|jgi:photosystem II stability/assembly factor-like uncharacterized protein|nr:T9SS type A sorting domain-containing protein [Candidatus Kapabacteria bacterium]
MQPCLRFYAVLTVFVAVIASVALAQHSNPSWRFLGPEGGNITHIAASGDTLFAVGERGRMFRTGVGGRWEEIVMPEDSFWMSGVSIASNELYTLFPDRGFDGYFSLLKSQNGGRTWQRQAIRSRTTDGRFSMRVSDVRILGNWAIILHNRGVVRVTNSTVPARLEINPEFVLGSTTLTCIASTNALVLCGSRDSTVFRSTDSGQTWQNSAIPFVPRSFSFVSNSRVLAISTNALWRSENAGISWQRTCDLPQNALVQALCATEKGIFVATTQGVITSDAITCNWRMFNQGLSLRRVTNIVANDSAVFVLLPDMGGWHRLSNNNFEQALLPNGRTAALLSATQTTFWANSSEGTIWRSRNGQDWLSFGNNPKPEKIIHAVYASELERDVFLNCGDEVWKTSNAGRTWDSVRIENLSTISSNSVANFVGLNDTIWFCNSGSVFLSVDKGMSFQRQVIFFNWQNPRRFRVEHLAIFEGIVWASGTYFNNLLGALEDYGDYMMPLSILKRNMQNELIPQEEYDWRYIAARKNELVRATYRRPCLLEYKPSNTDWKRFPAFPNPATYTYSLGATNKNIFVGTNGGLYMLNAIATSVADNSEQKNTSNIPQIRAFPNPTSESVSVSVMLPAPSTLRLSLFDALGKEIVRLADNEMASGEVRYSLATTAFPAGVYTLRLQAGLRVQTERIVIIR